MGKVGGREAGGVWPGQKQREWKGKGRMEIRDEEKVIEIEKNMVWKAKSEKGGTGAGWEGSGTAKMEELRIVS